MKKNTIKAFTLVEMLIVIVIIGILIAALMPRMQAAQGRARDVSRKTALSQVQTAIVTYQGDKGYRPGMGSGEHVGSEGATGGVGIDQISGQLLVAGMNSLPTDPINSDLSGLGTGTSTTNINKGEYGYLVTMRNGTKEGGFVLMAKTEVEGGSNRVVCSGGTSKTMENGRIGTNDDIHDIIPCTTLKKTESSTPTCNVTTGGECTYSEDSMLRYIVTY